MRIGSKIFEGRTYVMAIINVTPDSFWRDSRASAESALSAAMRAAEEGADILDIGAQSTRPGYAEVSAEEELARLEAPLAAILKECPLPVSVDTYFPRVADAALEMGAHMINDVWGLTRPGMAQTIAAHGAAACIMHNSPVPVTGDVFGEVKSFLSAQLKSALDAGIRADAICLDGGIGFAKDGAQSMRLLNGYARLKSLGYPLLLGCSRKSLFGGRVEDRLPPTLAATRMAAREGILFVRVHDVKSNVEEIKRVYEDSNYRA